MTDLLDALRAETPDAPPQTEPFLETTMTSTPDLATLRDALTAARPALTGEQQDAADALLVALTPRMDEPTWPGAVVVAECGATSETPMVRLLTGSWSCGCGEERSWRQIHDPRPLTSAERAEYGIPGECERHHAEPITDELVEQCIEASTFMFERCIEASTFMYPAWVRAVLRAAGHPEADR